MTRGRDSGCWGGGDAALQDAIANGHECLLPMRKPLLVKSCPREPSRGAKSSRYSSGQNTDDELEENHHHQLGNCKREVPTWVGGWLEEDAWGTQTMAHETECASTREQEASSWQYQLNTDHFFSCLPSVANPYRRQKPWLANGWGLEKK